jgi:predicted Zn-dependent protease
MLSCYSSSLTSVGIGDVLEIAEELKPFFRNDFTEEEKYFFGRSMSAYILGKYDLIESEKLTHYINQVGSVVAMASDKMTTLKGYRFLVLNDEQINTYATPSGMIFISLGILKLCENEDELASILAHEVQHIVLDYPMKLINSRIKQQSLIEIAKLSAIKAASENVELSEEYKQALIESFDNVLKEMLKIIESGVLNENELLTDKGTINILHRAGYSIEAFKSFLLKLPSYANESKYILTHSTPERRIKEIDKEIKRLGIISRQVLQERTSRFKDIMEETGIIN